MNNNCTRTVCAGQSKIRIVIISIAVPAVSVILILIFICIYLKLGKPKQMFPGISNFCSFYKSREFDKLWHQQVIKKLLTS